MGLSAENLSVTLGGRMVLDSVSIGLTPGKITAVLGANGAGKSTLLRALAALVPASAGQSALDGQDVTAMQPRARGRAIGYLPQDAQVHWNMRVDDLVALGRLPHGDRDPAAIAEALAQTDTSSLADRSVRTLSGGERARVLLARVLAGTPSWLLADEPLATLDPLHQIETLALFREVAARGTGVVIVLHDLTQAARIADDVVLLTRGRLLAAGPAAGVLTPTNLAEAYGIDVAFLPYPGGFALVPTEKT